MHFMIEYSNWTVAKFGVRYTTYLLTSWKMYITVGSDDTQKLKLEEIALMQKIL